MCDHHLGNRRPLEIVTDDGTPLPEHMLPSPLTHALLWLSAASTRHPEAVLSLGTSAVVRDWNPPRYPQVPPRPTQSQQHSGTHSAARSTATLRSQAGRAMGDKGIFLWAGGRGQGSRGASEREGVRGPGNVRTAAMPLRSASAERRPARPGIFQMPDPCHGVSPGGSHSLGACVWGVLARACCGRVWAVSGTQTFSAVWVETSLS